eukprot:1156113-Pelagomonas_calceolata.AAC.1
MQPQQRAKEFYTTLLIVHKGKNWGKGKEHCGCCTHRNSGASKPTLSANNEHHPQLMRACDDERQKEPRCCIGSMGEWGYGACSAKGGEGSGGEGHGHALWQGLLRVAQPI